MSAGLYYEAVYHRHRSPEPAYEVDVERICATTKRVQQLGGNFA